MEPTLFYKREGGGPPLVLLHGFLESSTMWKQIVTNLSKKYTCILIDLPGHGQSKHLSKPYSIDEVAVQVNEVLENLELPEVRMIGHSMGGYVGLAFAHLFPQKLHSLTLYHSKASGDTDQQKLNRDRAHHLLKERPIDFIREGIKALFPERYLLQEKQSIEKLINEAKEGNFPSYSYGLMAMKNRKERCDELKYKRIHYIAGDLDPIVPIETSKNEIALLENGKGIVLKGVGHMSYMEDPKKALEAITTCLV